MYKNYHYRLFMLLVLLLPLNVVGQIYPNSKGHQKIIKFSNRINIDEAKQIFVNDYGLDLNSTFVQNKPIIDRKGITHNKFQQFYKNIKIEYGTMIIHSKDGNVISINGELYNPSGLSLLSNLTPSRAFQKAISHIDAKRYLWADAEAAKSISYKKPEGELVIFPLLEKDTITFKLAYKFDIYATVPVSRGVVYIDAHNGSFLYNEPIIKHIHNIGSLRSNKKIENVANHSSFLSSGTADTRYSGNRIIETKAESNGTFTLNDDSRNVHTYNAENSPTNGTYQFTKVDFVDNDNNWTAAEYDNAARDNAALDAHWGAMNVFDFWTLLGRNSIDDAGMEIRSYVHVGTNYFNAFWNGSVMSYGDGSPDPLTGIDVVGHEMAHGVTTWTANLVYARESGAINEGFSDIFGAAVEFMAKGTGTNTNPNNETWLIGEDFLSNPLRSMSDPKSKGDPDTYNGINYIDASDNCIPAGGGGGNDYCGVHTNSGVLNHWFYILVEGKAGSNDAGDVYDVTGIGMTKSQEIAYLTLRDYLSPNSTFMDTRDGAIEVASNLYGSNSAERKATQDAFFAVNVGEQFIPFDTDLNLIEFTELVDISCGDNVVPKVKVRNTGVSTTINTIQFNYSIDGVSQTPYVWNGTLNIDQEKEISLPVINKSDVKLYELIVDAILTGDEDNSNNSLSSSFSINEKDNSPTEINTFNFFHENWLSFDEGNQNNLWVIDTPNKAKLNSVTSGTRAYITHATNNYPNETKSLLVSPCYDLTNIDDPRINFNMAFELQENFDIIYVEYSLDNSNWIVLGKASDPNWYNSDRIFESVEISNDCQNCPGAQWTGSSNGFKEYSFDLSELENESNIIFRFVFHSDASINDEGVVIDDFVIQEGTLAVNDFDVLNKSVVIYPNPSSSNYLITWKNSYDNIEIQIFDISGKLILDAKNISANSNSYNLDMANYSKGFYYAKIKLGEKSISKKIILK